MARRGIPLFAAELKPLESLKRERSVGPVQHYGWQK
jgi:hypothetical protein